jgi:hypothetical protein
MEREQALTLVERHVKNPTLVKHMLATEAIMKEVAKHLGEDVDLWGLVGLLHDLDYEMTEGDPSQHGLTTEKLLADKVSRDILNTIKAHNFEHLNIKPETRMEKALIAADAISGLVVACALVMPSKKLEEVRVETIKRKFKDKSFARSSSRERISFCEEIGVSKDEFFGMALKALQGISERLGL